MQIMDTTILVFRKPHAGAEIVAQVAWIKGALIRAQFSKQTGPADILGPQGKTFLLLLDPDSDETNQTRFRAIRFVDANEDVYFERDKQGNWTTGPGNKLRPKA